MDCLDFLRSIRHNHIIELLGSYTYKGQHNLIFPEYRIDLAAFLQLEERFESFREDLTFYNALDGLGSAIALVHNASFKHIDTRTSIQLIGYHHDIRPKNILVSPTTFLLADFGLARLKTADEDSKTYWKSGIGDWLAPECMDDDFSHQNVGRSIDIWSFGCLVAEIATYMEGGPLHVEEFRKKRTFFDPEKQWEDNGFFHKNDIKPEVEEWITKLATRPKNRSIRCLVASMQRVLQTDLSQRPKAADVSRILTYIAVKALFRTVETDLGHLNTSISSQGQSTSPYRRLSVWFEMERLKAWGLVLGMHTDSIDCPLVGKNVSTSARWSIILKKLHSNIGDLSREVEAMENSASSLSEAMPIPTSFEEDLRNLIQDLWEAVPWAYQKRMEQAWRQSSLETEDESNLFQIEHNARTVRSSYSKIGVFAAMRRLDQALWKELEIVGMEQKKLVLRSSQIEVTDSLGQCHDLGWYRPVEAYRPSQDSTKMNRSRVLIEWMLYSPAWNGQSDEEKVLKVARLAELLHYPKPQGFNVLNCVGFIPPSANLINEGFGFVYSFPTATDGVPVNDPKTLLKLISLGGSTLLLEDKFHIASSLASTVYELHSAGWLHKNIQSSNTLLFLDASGRATETTYLIGFHHSRPDGEIWYSDTDIHENSRTEYQDPAYVPGHTRFQKSFDYYSVGILLLELAFSQPISAFQAQHPLERGERFRQLLLKRYVGKLGPKMGSCYRDVVAACLTGELGPVEEEPDADDEMVGFYWNVVARLGNCSVL